MAEQKKRGDILVVMCVGVGVALRATLMSPPAPHSSILCGNLLGWLFRAQFAQHGLSLDGSESSVTRLLKPGCCQDVGYHSQLSVPRGRPGSCPEPESFLGTGSLSHALFALGCPGPGLPGWQTDLWWQLSSIWTVPQARLGQSFPNKGSAEEMDKKRDRKEGHGLRKPPPQLRGQDRFLSGRETKTRKNKGSRALLSFCATERSNLQILQALLIGEIWPYGKVSYRCLGWREYL